MYQGIVIHKKLILSLALLIRELLFEFWATKGTYAFYLFSMLTTPNDIRKTKGIGSAVRTSSQKPSNLVGGNVKSFIKRQSVKKLDASVS